MTVESRVPDRAALGAALGQNRPPHSIGITGRIRPEYALGAAVLIEVRKRAESARALAKRLNLDVPLVQEALNELEKFGWVSRSQVGMLVIYRAVSETGRE